MLEDTDHPEKWTQEGCPHSHPLSRGLSEQEGPDSSWVLIAG